MRKNIKTNLKYWRICPKHKRFGDIDKIMMGSCPLEVLRDAGWLFFGEKDIIKVEPNLWVFRTSYRDFLLKIEK